MPSRWRADFTAAKDKHAGISGNLLQAEGHACNGAQGPSTSTGRLRSKGQALSSYCGAAKLIPGSAGSHRHRRAAGFGPSPRQQPLS